MIQRNKQSRKSTYGSSKKAALRQAEDKFPEFNWNYYEEEKVTAPNQKFRNKDPKYQKYLAETSSSKSVPSETLAHTSSINRAHNQKTLFVELHSKFHDDIMKFVYD